MLNAESAEWDDAWNTGRVYQKGPEVLPPGGFFTWIEFLLRPLASSSTSATPASIETKIGLKNQ